MSTEALARNGNRVLVADDSGVSLVDLTADTSTLLDPDELLTLLEFDDGWRPVSLSTGLVWDDLTPATDLALAAALAEMPGWAAHANALVKGYRFANSRQAASFAHALLGYANEVNHHPHVEVSHENVFVRYRTRMAGGITPADLICAQKADTLSQERVELSARATKPRRLSRKPKKFEAKLLSLSEIPARLDEAVDKLQLRLLGDGGWRLPLHSAPFVSSGIAQYGAEQVLRELVRQGAPEALLAHPPSVDVRVLVADQQHDLTAEVTALRQTAERRVGRKRLSKTRREALVQEHVDFHLPGVLKRFANRVVNEAFAFGRAKAIEAFLRPKQGDAGMVLAKKSALLLSDEARRQVPGPDDPLTLAQNVFVDAVVQSAVMDTNTCDECQAVDGEVMEFGSAKQEELHPPYVKCLGGDRCRCVQIALLSDGREIEVDEVDEDTIE